LKILLKENVDIPIKFIFLRDIIIKGYSAYKLAPNGLTYVVTYGNAHTIAKNTGKNFSNRFNWKIGHKITNTGKMFKYNNVTVASISNVLNTEIIEVTDNTKSGNKFLNASSAQTILPIPVRYDLFTGNLPHPFDPRGNFTTKQPVYSNRKNTAISKDEEDTMDVEDMKSYANYKRYLKMFNLSDSGSNDMTEFTKENTVNLIEEKYRNNANRTNYYVSEPCYYDGPKGLKRLDGNSTVIPVVYPGVVEDILTGQFKQNNGYLNSEYLEIN